MALASAIITSARYDLRDPNLSQYSDAELLDYLNRGLVQLDGVLSSINSDWINATAAVTLATASSSATAPTRCLAILQLWYSTTQWTRRTLDAIRYEQRINYGTTGRPSYYCLQGETIQFDITSDAEYALTAIYNQYSATLTAASTMPYSSHFDQPLRESIVIQAKRREEYDVNLDAVLYDFFMDYALNKAMKRKFAKKAYYLDF